MDIKNKKKTTNYYLSLFWTYSIESVTTGEETPYYLVRVNELPGICTDAPSISEAMEDIKEAMTGAFERYLSHNEPIPEPLSEKKCKGNISYRTNKNRHYRIATEDNESQNHSAKSSTNA